MSLNLTPVGGWLVAALITAVIAAAILGLRATVGRPTGSRQRILLALRIIAALLVVFLMLRPTLVHTTTKKQSATLVLLVDQSRSMSVGDAFQGQRRWDAIRTALQDAAPVLEELSEDLEIQVYAFDGELQSREMSNGTVALPDEPTGPQSAIGSALSDVLQREEGKRLAGIIVFSDGAQRAFAPRDVPPQVIARQLYDRGYPIHTLAVGEARGLGNVRDVALRDLLVNQTVFVKNQLAVVGTVSIDGYVEQDVPVEMFFESPGGQMQKVARDNVRALDDSAQLETALTYEPEVAGEYKLTLRALPQPGELVLTNNELSTFVTVLDGGLNVLYLEGSLRPEQKFLRWSLDASVDIQFDYLRINARQPETRPGDFAQRFEPGRYDVYIIGDLAAAAFEAGELAQLADAVRGGAGLIMLGGVYSFGAGDYAKTPLAEVLPVRMEPLERQPFGEPIRPDLHLPYPPRVVPTPAGIRHFVMLLAPPERNGAAWQELDPLDGGNRFLAPAPRTLVLAESQDDDPLLVAGDFGAGRTMAFAGDSTWRWWMQGQQNAHRRFWRQVILWLARRDAAQDGNVWVKLPRRRYAPSERVELTAGAQSAEGTPVLDAQFSAVVRSPSGEEHPVTLYRQGDALGGAFLETQEPGDYTVEVTATDAAGELLGVARARFLVFEQDLELDNPAADPSLLASLSSTTGGESLAPEELPRLLRRIQVEPPQLELDVVTQLTLWDRWPLLLLMAGTCIAEWYLRKRWGMV